MRVSGGKCSLFFWFWYWSHIKWCCIWVIESNNERYCIFSPENMEKHCGGTWLLQCPKYSCRICRHSVTTISQYSSISSCTNEWRLLIGITFLHPHELNVGKLLWNITWAEIIILDNSYEWTTEMLWIPKCRLIKCLTLHSVVSYTYI